MNAAYTAVWTTVLWLALKVAPMTAQQAAWQGVLAPVLMVAYQVALRDALMTARQVAYRVASRDASAAANQVALKDALRIASTDSKLNDSSFWRSLSEVSYLYTDYSMSALRQFHFLLTDECNLRCVYCFHAKHPRTMTAQIMTRAIDWCLSMCGKEMRIQFFGGEPTLNWPVLSLAVRYGDMRAREIGKQVGFGLVTNASTLTIERATFCKNNRIGVLLSYDGPHTNDLTRGHTADIVAGLQNALAAGMRSSVAMQLPSGHTRFMYENFVAIEEMGFSTIAINPVTHCYAPYNAEDWDNIAIGLERLGEHQYKRYATGKGAVYSQFSNQIQSIKKVANTSDWAPQTRDASCGACKGSMAIDCDGNIVPCHEMPCGSDFERYIMGNVIDGTYDASIRKRFLEARNFEPCKECPSTLCGSCRTTNYWATGDEFTPCLEACIFHLKLFETAVNVYNRLITDGIMQGQPFILYRSIEETIVDLQARDALRHCNS